MDDSFDWSLIQRYFRETPFFLTRHQFDSYHDLVFNKIPSIIRVLNSKLTVLKTAEDQVTRLHEIKPYIGGKDGTGIYYSKPVIYDQGSTRPLFPNEARLKDLPYMMDLHVDVDIEYHDFSEKTPKVTTKKFKNILIGQLPIMVRSKMCSLYGKSDSVLQELGECPYDQGGYFIMNGKEKVVIAQERISTNRIFFNKVDESTINQSNFSWSGFLRCTSRENTLFPKTITFGILSKEYLKGKRQNAIVVTCPQILTKTQALFEIPLFIMFRALGVESDREIIRHIVPDMDDPLNKPLLELLRYSVIDPGNSPQQRRIYSQVDALDYLKHFVKYSDPNIARMIVTDEFLPNIGQNFANKALMLGHIINKIIRISLGLLPEIDRDNVMYKRVDTTGFAMADLFRDFYNDFRNHVRDTLDRFYNRDEGNWKKLGLLNMVNSDNYTKIFKDEFIRVGFDKMLRGQWGVNLTRNRMVADSRKLGVVQDLNRKSYMGYVSHVRCLVTPMDDTLKITGPRKLRAPIWGYICPIESPDGSHIGLLKHFSMLTYTTLGSSPEVLESLLLEKGVVVLGKLSQLQIQSDTKVLIDDVWFGMTSDPFELYTFLLEARRNGDIDIYTGLTWNFLQNELHLRTEKGRFSRPLYIVKDNVRVIDTLPKKEREGSFESLLGKAIEYIDAEEADMCLIAMRPEDLGDKLKKYTHCEIHPSTILSAYSASIPFPHHIPAPRTVFGAAQIKQAIGVYATNFNNRIDRATYILHYPQSALVKTRYTQAFNAEALPFGENLIVAVATYTGYNVEDSVILNRSSIERGMFNTSVYKSAVYQEERSNSGRVVRFTDPQQLGVDVKNWDSTKPVYYNRDGLPTENTYIHDGDTFVGMVDSHLEGEQRVYTDVSVKADKTIYGMVDKVFRFSDPNNSDLQRVKIRFRKMRFPELGDKVASRYAIKGVCGMVIPHEDMPFTADGLVPDIIVNPHSFPSRMSMGQFLEGILSKAACSLGTMFDGTAFDNVNMDAVYDKLEEMGMNRHGDEILYNGRTGEQIPTHIYIAPTYYCRLKHMVADKINYRSSDGPRSMATFQPIKGRARGGGLRIGEMEMNVLLGHGIAQFTQESLMLKSDGRLRNSRGLDQVYTFPIDETTGYQAITNPRDGTAFSTPGVSINSAVNVAIPANFKILLQELEGLNVAAKLMTHSDESDADKNEINEELELDMDLDEEYENDNEEMED